MKVIDKKGVNSLKSLSNSYTSLIMRTFLEWLCWDEIQHELQRKGDIECYDKVMESSPNYPKIWWYNLFLEYKQMAKEYFHRIEIGIR